MKITLELKDEDRAKLLKLATEEPGRDLARLVSEAIDLFLRTRERQQRLNQSTQALRGCISPEQAEEFRTTLAKIRSSWR